MLSVTGGTNADRRDRLDVWGVLLVVLGAAWLVASAARGGLRTAVSEAWIGVVRHAAAPPGAPDARNQWAGLYYNALDALAHQPLPPPTTIAVVLTPAHLPKFSGASAARMYETIYRLYPHRVDFYIRGETGAEQLFWFDSPPDHVPRVPPLWQHEYVLVADARRGPAAGDYELVYGNAEARVYRRKGG